MSIHALIDGHVDAGRLHLIDVLPGDPVSSRTMVVSPDIHELLEGPWESADAGRRAARLLADLHAFVKGDVISLSLTPYKHKSAYMGRLDKPEHEVWDIRSRDPNPGLRVFGRFADVDTFVGLVWRPRSVEWRGRKSLGDRTSLEWELEKLKCEEEWERLFPGLPPIHGDYASDYLSQNVIAI